MDQGEALDLEAKARPIGGAAAAGERPITQRQVMLIYFEQRLAKRLLNDNKVQKFMCS